MGYVTWKIERTPFIDNLYVTESTVELEDYYDPLLSVSIEDGRDNFTFKLLNRNSEYDNYFNTNDKFTFYRVANSETFATDGTDVLMVGTLRNASETISSNNDQIQLEGYNYSEAIMSAIVFIDIVNKTPPTAIEQALDNAGEKNQNFKVGWNSENNAAIASLTFPTITEERFFNKPLKKVIQKYSEDPETNNGSFLWYVDKDNTLVWRKKTDVISHTFDLDTDDYISYKDGKDLNDIKNFIILKGGLDPAGRQIQTRYINWSSLARHGSKYHFIPSEVNTSQNLVDMDLFKSYETDNTNETYPDEFKTGSAFTTDWKSKYTYTTKQYSISVDEDNVTIDEGSELANKKAYAELLRTETKLRLEAEGQLFASKRAFGKLQIDITFRAGDKSWILGENVSCTIPNISDEQKVMRVVDIQYSSNTDTFTLEEDEGTI